MWGMSGVERESVESVKESRAAGRGMAFIASGPCGFRDSSEKGANQNGISGMRVIVLHSVVVGSFRARNRSHGIRHPQSEPLTFSGALGELYGRADADSTGCGVAL